MHLLVAHNNVLIRLIYKGDGTHTQPCPDLQDQVKQLQVYQDHQINSIKDVVKQLQCDVSTMETRIVGQVSSMIKKTDDRVQQMETRIMGQVSNIIKETEDRVQQMAFNVLQRNYEGLLTSNADLQKQLLFTQNKLSLTEQQLLGIQSMVTCSRLWVVSHDQFTIGKEIGRGAWATIHETTFRGTIVAAKCLHNLISTSKTKELFQREMEIALQCQHQNIVTFFGATLEGAPVILMELMDMNLREAYEQGSDITHHVPRIFYDVAKALHFLHTRPDPVIHRDVSSANVLLKVLYNGEWLAKLGDLGTAKIQQQTATAGPGAIAYGAPEVGDFKKHSPKMDVYSFGIVMIETLTKTHPFEIVDTLKSQVRQQHPQFYQLVTSCAKQQSSDRPTMYDVLVKINGIEVP